MFKKLSSRYTSVLYVQIWEARLKVTNIATNESYDDAPLVAIETTDKGEKLISRIGKQTNTSIASNQEVVNPFSHPRTLFSDFYVAEKLLQHAFKELSKAKYLRPRPKVIIHPMEKTEGGLTMIERRAFKELAAGAGAVETKLHTGKSLDINAIDFDRIEENKELSYNTTHHNKAPSNIMVTVFYFIIIVSFALVIFGKK